MLAGILISEIAVKMSINIIKAFIEMRKIIIANNNIFERLSILEIKQLENEKQFKRFLDSLQNEKEFKQKIFFQGQIYDAYSLIIDIIKKAKQKILIIDNNEMYHLGASIKDLGKKCFGINRIEDMNIIEKIMNM